MGPGGCFGGTALLRDDGVVRRTATAAVDSEIFTLTREAFVRIKLAPPPARSEALQALMRLPAMGALPLPTLEAIASSMDEYWIPPRKGGDGAAAEPPDDAYGDPLRDGMSEAGDNYLMLISAGEIVTILEEEAAAELAPESSKDAKDKSRRCALRRLDPTGPLGNSHAAAILPPCNRWLARPASSTPPPRHHPAVSADRDPSPATIVAVEPLHGRYGRRVKQSKTAE